MRLIADIGSTYVLVRRHQCYSIVKAVAFWSPSRHKLTRRFFKI